MPRIELVFTHGSCDVASLTWGHVMIVIFSVCVCVFYPHQGLQPLEAHLAAGGIAVGEGAAYLSRRSFCVYLAGREGVCRATHKSRRTPGWP